MLVREAGALVRESAESAFEEARVVRTAVQFEQRERDAGGAVRVAGEILLRRRAHRRHRRPRPAVAGAIRVCEEMFAEAARFGEEAVAAEAAVDGAEAGDCTGSAADDVERHPGDLVTELAVDEAQRVAFELTIVEE